MTRAQEVDTAHVVWIPWVCVSDTRHVPTWIKCSRTSNGVCGGFVHMGSMYRIPVCGQVHRAGPHVHRLYVVCAHSCVSWSVSVMKAGIKSTLRTAEPSAPVWWISADCINVERIHICMKGTWELCDACIKGKSVWSRHGTGWCVCVLLVLVV